MPHVARRVLPACVVSLAFVFVLSGCDSLTGSESQGSQEDEQVFTLDSVSVRIPDLPAEVDISDRGTAAFPYTVEVTNNNTVEVKDLAVDVSFGIVEYGPTGRRYTSIVFSEFGGGDDQVGTLAAGESIAQRDTMAVPWQNSESVELCYSYDLDSADLMAKTYDGTCPYSPR